MQYRDPAERPIWCDFRGYQIPLLSCLSCKRFPCPASSKYHDLLEKSLFTEQLVTGTVSRRVKMYIFKLNDGSLREASPAFDPDSFDDAVLSNVAEIYCVSKTLIKQTKLVVKPKEEIAAIRQKNKKQKEQK